MYKNTFPEAAAREVRGLVNVSTISIEWCDGANEGPQL